MLREVSIELCSSSDPVERACKPKKIEMIISKNKKISAHELKKKIYVCTHKEEMLYLLTKSLAAAMMKMK